MYSIPRVFAFYVPRSSSDAHRRLIDAPPPYGVDWEPPAGTDLQWGDRIVFGSTSMNSRVRPGGWSTAVIRFRVFSVSAFRTEQSRAGALAIVGGHDDFEAPGTELGELAEELRLSANQRSVRPLHVPAWLPFALR
ncbi:hypothetical protein OHS33_39205 (plasmid) [Streptomyces sp. NBC_00536]|uniref:hypothetical protein n=1 Tax=Streptomyces sp. NBC_00536 TaxID=2975769 RepID=UPI002E812638|nr:hypothetical protein [Streptomyces sp. NBC_00536]WUC84388.1 hypothetical protein OHS33_39205 [Streptomyces sp. NBC_00536]